MGLFAVIRRGRSSRHGEHRAAQNEGPPKPQANRDAKKKDYKEKEMERPKYSAEERKFYESRNLALPNVVAAPSDSDDDENQEQRRAPIPLIHRTSTGTFPISKSEAWRQDADQSIIRRARSAAEANPSTSTSPSWRPALATDPPHSRQSPKPTSTIPPGPDLPKPCHVPAKRRSFTEAARTLLRRPVSQSERSDISAKTTATEWPDAQQIAAIGGVQNPPAARPDCGPSSLGPQRQNPSKPSIFRVNAGLPSSSHSPGVPAESGGTRQHRGRLAPCVSPAAESPANKPLMLPLEMRRAQNQADAREMHARASRAQISSSPRIRNAASGQVLPNIDSRTGPGPSPFDALPTSPSAPAVPPRSVHRPALIAEPFDTPRRSRLSDEMKRCSHSFESRLNKPPPMTCHICGIQNVQYILMCRLCQLRKCRICWRLPAVEEMVREKEIRDMGNDGSNAAYRDSANDMW